ncbi:hypothetical protein ABSA28_00353 [Candidatus Hepatincolaceae symbiont of Richtersius coronifer]
MSRSLKKLTNHNISAKKFDHYNAKVNGEYVFRLSRWYIYYPLLLYILIVIILPYIYFLNYLQVTEGLTKEQINNIVDWQSTIFLICSGITLFFLVFYIHRISKYRSTSLKIQRKVVFVKQEYTDTKVDFNRVDDIYVEQSFLGKIFNYGSIKLAQRTIDLRNPFHGIVLVVFNTMGNFKYNRQKVAWLIKANKYVNKELLKEEVKK